jgi:hypothetical protein
VNNPKKPGVSLNETYLGLLYPTEDYRVFGYLSNTKIKFILVTTDQDVRDADVRNVSYMYRSLFLSSLNNSAPPSVLSFDGFYAFGKELVNSPALQGDWCSRLTLEWVGSFFTGFMQHM